MESRQSGAPQECTDVGAIAAIDGCECGRREVGKGYASGPDNFGAVWATRVYLRIRSTLGKYVL